jgi:hypothetical protein
MDLSFPVMMGVTACVAIVAIYFLFVRKLLNKQGQQQTAARAPEAKP